jgi:hypothetical protein
MSTKTAGTIAALTTFVLLILIAILSVFLEVITLNGTSESQGFNAISISVICQSVGLLLAVIIVRMLTKLFIEKFSWKNVPAIIAAIIAGTTFGGIVSFLSVIISILAAGIR